MKRVEEQGWRAARGPVEDGPGVGVVDVPIGEVKTLPGTSNAGQQFPTGG